MGRGLSELLAGAGAIAAVALFAPASAVAHPCAGANAKASAAASFLSVNSATWVGMHRPDIAAHEVQRRARDLRQCPAREHPGRLRVWPRRAHLTADRLRVPHHPLVRRGTHRERADVRDE